MWIEPPKIFTAETLQVKKKQKGNRRIFLGYKSSLSGFPLPSSGNPTFSFYASED
jgi:hypothetical protein